MSQTPSLRRRLLLALAGTALLLGVLVTTASADEYGGLGGLGVFTPGVNGGHLEVNPEGNHAFGVDPADGSSYIADEIKVAGKRFFQIQRLGSKGEYLAETRVELGSQAYQLEGVAIDSAKGRLYLLVVTPRESENEEIREKISEDEGKLETKQESLKKKREKSEPTEPLEKEIKTLEGKIKKLEEEVLRFDPETPAAAELYAFSTATLEPAAGTEAGLLAGETTLGAFSEIAGVPLLDPHGIAVDPVTHDVLILGQENVSTKKGYVESEGLRAAAQRVHTEGADAGKLGPRYVDAEDCLDEGRAIEGEPACAESSGPPSSPFVSPGGRLFGERLGELWEIPATEGVAEGASESFEPGSPPRVYEAKPKRLFTIGHGQGIGGEEGIVEPVSEEEGGGGALAFLSTGAGKGKIFLDANIAAEEGEGRRTENQGVAVLEYSESGGPPKARELGWTAGQNETGENEKCFLPLGNAQVLVGAGGGGRPLLFDAKTAHEGKPATVNILQFGAGGEECGNARATPPGVSVLGDPVTKLPKGKTASLSLDVFAADALGVEWRFKDNGKQEADEPPVLETYPFPTQAPALTHEFKHGGSYEVVAVVEPDDFGPTIEVHSNVTVEGGEETKQEEEARQKREEEAKKEEEAKQQREEEAKQEEEEGKHNEEAQKKREEEAKKEEEAKQQREEEAKREEERSDGAPIGAEFSYTSPATVSQSAKFAAKVTDPSNRASPHAQYKYVWEFGDGATAEGGGGREFRAEHVYAIAGRYDVKLEVTDEAGRTTVQTHVVQVNALPVLASIASVGVPGAGNSGGGGGGGSGGIQGVTSGTHVPDAKLAGTASLAVSGSGAVTLRLACPAGEASCRGTVTLRTLGAVKASAHGGKRVLTLAAGSFTVVGGKVKAVTLHLSAAARALLARARVLRVQATVLAHDPAGATHTTRAIVTLRIAKPSHRPKH